MKPLDFAKTYLDFGWSLIPIAPDTKKPTIKWAEFQERRPTITEVEEWLKKGWYLAVVTGDISSILIVDDDRVKHGLKEWGFESPVIATTSNGGKHYYYKYDREIHSHSNTKLFIDLKAWHSYCLVPPFKDRTWLSKPSENLSKLTPLQDEIVRLINSDMEREGNAEPLKMADFLDLDEGTRTTLFYQYACSLFSTMEKQGMDKDGVLRILAGVNQTYNPPLNKNEFKYNTSRAYEFIKSSSEQEQNRVIPKADGTDLIRFNPIPLSEISGEHANIDWIWEGYIAKGELTLCSALPKVGKSTLIAHLIKSIQTGESLAGQPVVKSKILVISEESKSLWARKREDMELDAPVWVIPQPFMEKPTERQWIQLIKSAADFTKANDIDLVVIDTITSFWHVRDEGSAPEVQAALLPLNYITKVGAAVMVVHHHRKSGGDEGVASRGSTAFGSAVSIVLEVTRKERDNPNNSQRVLKTFSRFEESPNEIVIELIGDHYVTLGTPGEVSKQAKLEKLLQSLPVAPQGLTVKEIFEAWDIDEQGRRPSRSTITRYLGDLQFQSNVTITGEIATNTKSAPKYGRIAILYTPDKSNQSTPLSLKDESISTPKSLTGNTMLTEDNYEQKDPYGKEYWKLQVKPEDRPDWIKKRYGLD